MRQNIHSPISISKSRLNLIVVNIKIEKSRIVFNNNIEIEIKFKNSFQ